MLAVVGILVFLVGGISALATALFLSMQGESKASTLPSADPEQRDGKSLGDRGDDGPPQVLATPETPASSDVPPPASEEPGSSDDAADVSVEEREPGAPAEDDEVPVVLEDSGSVDGSASEATGSGIEDEEEIVLEDEPEAPPEPRSLDAPDEVTPSIPAHATAACEQTRAKASAALAKQDWKTLLAESRKRSCWPRSEWEARTRYLVWALLELGQFDACIKAGKRSKNAGVRRLVDVCEERKP